MVRPHGGTLIDCIVDPVARAETERLAACLMTLPTGTAVDETTIDLVCDLVRVLVAHGADVERVLAGMRALA